MERFIGVERRWIHEHDMNVPFCVDNVQILFLDANQYVSSTPYNFLNSICISFQSCPGAVMIVFRLANGRCLLHTGDFRACADMEMMPSFWNHHIDTVYLDTT